MSNADSGRTVDSGPTVGSGRTVAVVPAFNEQDALPGVLRTLADAVPDIDVVVVDDGSQDDTAAVARAAGVVCVRLPFNMGIGGALRAGFRYARDNGYECAVQFDGDGQHRANQIPLLLAATGDGVDMVIGNRFATPTYRVGVGRRAAMTVLRVSVRALCGEQFRDTSSGFRAVREPLLSAFAFDYPVEYMDSVETLVAACRAGYRVVEVPVVMGERAGGVPSTRNVRLAYHYARLVVALVGGSRRALPPRVA